MNGRHELLPLDVLRYKILKTLHYREIIEIVSVIVIFLDLRWIVVKVLNFIWKAALKIVDGIRKEGLFDNEFLATVQSKLAPSQQQAPAQQVPEAQPIDWSQVPVMSE